MTNTPMSDLDPKVKELLDAARYVVDTGERNGLYRLGNAIAAFDPPKPEPVPVIPAWEEFIMLPGVKNHKWGDANTCASVRANGNLIWHGTYESIRYLTSKAPTE